MKCTIKLIVIGGSWGGIQASLAILRDLPGNYRIPILLILHRLKNTESELELIYDKKLKLKVREVDEKEQIEAGYVYLAPPNYHVLIEKDETFSLDVSETVNYSRPSIDVSFSSASDVFGTETLGILLSGANRDGSQGLKRIADGGGVAIVQDPLEAEIDTMPKSAIELIPGCLIYNVSGIKEVLIQLNDC